MGVATPVIQVHSVPTFKAYQRLQLWHSFRSLRPLIPFAILALVCFALAPFFPLEQQGAPARYQAMLNVLFLPGIIFVLVPALVIISAKNRWRVATDLRATRTYHFDDYGIRLSAETFQSAVTWEHIVLAKRSGGQVLLGTAQKQFYIVPIGDFAPAELYDEFRKLVTEKVADSNL